MILHAQVLWDVPGNQDTAEIWVLPHPDARPTFPHSFQNSGIALFQGLSSCQEPSNWPGKTSSTGCKHPRPSALWPVRKWPPQWTPLCQSVPTWRLNSWCLRTAGTGGSAFRSYFGEYLRWEVLATAQIIAPSLNRLIQWLSSILSWSRCLPLCASPACNALGSQKRHLIFWITDNCHVGGPQLSPALLLFLGQALAQGLCTSRFSLVPSCQVSVHIFPLSVAAPDQLDESHRLF